jgi:hypothetical protein
MVKPVMAAVSGNAAESGKNQAGNPDGGYNTIKFEKKTQEDKSKLDNKDSSQKETASTNNPANTDKIKVEILNYSGFEGLGEKIAKSLEIGGIEVSYTEMKQIEENTLIIERNDRKAGSEVQKAIGMWQIVKWPDDKSGYDVTVKLGADFNP